MRWRLIVISALVALAGCAGARSAAWPAAAADGSLTIARDVASAGSARQRVVSDDASLVLWFASEHEGSMDTCGCPHRPRGSLARLARYVDASRAANPDTLGLLVHAGAYASTRLGRDLTLRADARVANAAMDDGLAMAGFDAVNVTLHDLPWRGSQPTWPSSAVSANIVGPPERALPTHRLFVRDGLRVAITGVTAPGLEPMQPDGFHFVDPAQSLRVLLPTLADEADLVVVLAFGLGRDTSHLAELPGVDILIEGGGYGPRMSAFTHRQAVWARANRQTETLGELRVALADARVARVIDRAIDLDPSVRSRGDLARLTRRTQRAIDAAREEADRADAAAWR